MSNPTPQNAVTIPLPTEINKNQIFDQMTQEIHISRPVIEKSIQLLSEGNTVPFIARYRKEATGGLDETQLRDIQKKYEQLINVNQRKIDVLRLISEQGKLTDEIAKKILGCSTLQEVEDLYLPFKPKFKTLGTKARERGLEPLAVLIREGKQKGDPLQLAESFVNPEKEVPTPELALDGAIDIIAEDIGSEPAGRKMVREVVLKRGIMKAVVNKEKIEKGKGEGETSEKSEQVEPENLGKKTVDPAVFQDYFDFRTELSQLKSYQIMAINRGEELDYLSVDIDSPDEDLLVELKKMNLTDYPKTSALIPYFEKAIDAGFKRYIIRSIKREIRTAIREDAEAHAIKVFATNLKNLLMQPPIKGRAIIGIDPGFRTGCKVAVIDQFGKFLENNVIYPHQPKNKIEEAKKILLELAKKHNAYTFAVGNGTASRETEQLLADMIKENPNMTPPLEYSIVSEAGASIYSASELAKEEFPDLDLTVRGAISIARRLQDPLAELIKIDPKSIGVGQYQHDVNQSDLKKELDAVIEDCVNGVGVDLNTASSKLLEYVSGLTKRVAKEIVSAREKNGPYQSRKQLNEIKGLGPKAFEQSAGFLKIRNALNPLDRTFVHPESYDLAIKLIKEASLTPEMIVDPKQRAKVKDNLLSLRPNGLAKQYNEDPDKIRYLIDQLIKPDLDPRDSLAAPILRKDVLSIDDLKEGMIIKGTIRNVVDFGAFVDIGVKVNGLVHKSEIANKFVSNPAEYLAVGDVKDFMVLSVDKARSRIQLSLKKADSAVSTKSNLKTK